MYCYKYTSVFIIRNLYYDFHAQVGDGMPSSEASVPDTDADMGGVTGRGEGGRRGRAWQRRRSGRGKRMTSIIGHRSFPLRTSDSDCYVDIMLIAFHEYIVHILRGRGRERERGRGEIEGEGSRLTDQPHACFEWK